MVQTARELSGAEIMIQLRSADENRPTLRLVKLRVVPQRLLTAPIPPAVEESPFNQRLTFETFVVGPGNRLAQAACLAVARRPADAYNPLFLYGGWARQNPPAALDRTLYPRDQAKPPCRLCVVGEFLNDLVAIQSHDVVEFRNTYRTYNILMIDDIQFIAGKERTQEEFFHTFNDLYNSQRQIVLSSDRSPREMATLEDRFARASNGG